MLFPLLLVPVLLFPLLLPSLWLAQALPQLLEVGPPYGSPNEVCAVQRVALFGPHPSGTLQVN